MKQLVPTNDSSRFLNDLCSMTKVIPVLTFNSVEDAIPLTEATTGGGLPILEITLRTVNSLRIIKRISEETKVLVGAGTIITQKDVKNAIDAGAKFGVSPGVTQDLINSCESEGLPLLAGVSSVSEAMKMLERGYDIMKFFPAESLGGVKALRAIGGPLPQISFCPTGGISQDNAKDYVIEKNVACIGGSWIATSDLIDSKNWEKIHNLALDASKIGKR